MSDAGKEQSIASLSANGNQRSCNTPLRASLVALTCFLRRLPLFFAAKPKTPLRVLCLIAFDTLCVLRTFQPLPRHRIRVLACLLDLGGCTNAALDRKGFPAQEYQATRRWLDTAGVGATVHEYLRQLRQLERRRPLPGGDHLRFGEVRSYREAVVRLSLGTLAAIAVGNGCVERGILATKRDHDLAALFQIVMLCQIIDDVLDYTVDLSAGLPSFLTAAASLPQGLSWTTEAARGYARGSAVPRNASAFPFRLAVWIVYAVTRLVIRTGCWQQRVKFARRSGSGHQQPVHS